MRPRTLTGLLLLLLLLAPYPLAAQPPADGWRYQEHLRVYIVGDSVLWKVILSGGNLTLSGLQEAEDEMVGVSEYFIFSSRYEDWVNEYDLFGKHGLNLLDFIEIPPTGAFLLVKAESQEAAEKAASLLGSVLKLAFVMYEAEEGAFVFYSHADFTLLIDSLWGAMPTALGGFSDLSTKTSFLSEAFPIFSFRGWPMGTSFTHEITFAVVRASFLTSPELTFNSVFPEAKELRASPFSNSSSIEYQVVGGFFTSGPGVIEHHDNNISSTLRVVAGAGEVLPMVDVRMLQNLPLLLVTREVDRGSVGKDSIIEVRLRLKNIAGPGAPNIENVTVREDWWEPYFDLVRGDVEQTIRRVPPGGEEGMAYQLRVKTDSATDVIAPSNPIAYSFKVGNHTFESQARVNGLIIALNAIKPALRIEALTDSPALAIGRVKEIALKVHNYGNSSAFTLKVGNETKASLLPNEVWSVNATILTGSIGLGSESRSWTLEWMEDGQLRTMNSNTITLYHHYNDPTIANIKVSKKPVLSEAAGKLYVNTSISLENMGSEVLRGIEVVDTLPQAWVFVDGALEHEDGRLRAFVERLEVKGRTTLSYLAEVTNAHENYVTTPASIKFPWLDRTMVHLSNSSALPLGVEVTRDASLKMAFKGSHSSISAEVINLGRFPIYNISVRAPEGTFFQRVKGNASNEGKVLSVGERLGLGYDVEFTKSGDYELPNATASFIFASSTHTLYTNGLSFMVFAPPFVEIKAPSSIVENRPFTIEVILRNPSNLTVTDIAVHIDAPEDLQILEGSLSPRVDILRGYENVSFTVRAVSSRAASFPLDPSVAFKYVDEGLMGPSKAIVIQIVDDVQQRYTIPLGIAFIAAIVVILSVRRASHVKVAPRAG